MNNLYVSLSHIEITSQDFNKDSQKRIDYFKIKNN
jgi:hypothetical protein